VVNAAVSEEVRHLTGCPEAFFPLSFASYIKRSTSARDRIRSTDLLARLGGDEFAVLLVGADEAQARVVMDDGKRVERGNGDLHAGRVIDRRDQSEQAETGRDLEGL
jgi:Diguanylate cyclase, GGDEF domain